MLLFMGCLLKDCDTLKQRGILDSQTIHLVIKSKQSSRSLAHSAWNLSANKPCHQDRSRKGKSSEVHQPADVSYPRGESAVFIKPDVPKVHTQGLDVGSPECMTRVLQNPSIQQPLCNMDLMRQFILEHPDMQ